MSSARRTRRLLALLATSAALTVALATASTTSGCGSSYHPDTTPADADSSSDGMTTGDDATADAGSDGNTCGADLQFDPKNCGRCGHDCLGGACNAAKCQAFELAGISAANLAYVLLHGSYVYASSIRIEVGAASGIWRIPKAGGVAEPYVTLERAQAMAVLGDTLYFLVTDFPENGVESHGGLWSCPLAGPVPCVPTLVAAADTPLAIHVDRGRVYYTDSALTAGVMSFAPPGPPVVLIANSPTDGFGAAANLYVDGDAVFLTTTVSASLPSARARLFQSFPDAGDQSLYTYASATVLDGDLFGSPDELLFSAFEYKGTATGGVVRRVPRSGVGGCDLGGTTNVRPLGIHADATRVYWVNQGKGATTPFLNGSVVTCARAGCCTTPDVLWTGTWPKAITGDDDALYFATVNGTGSVWKIAKP